MRDKNIVLTGFMGAGKSTVGQKLANILNMKIADTDAIIESEVGITISEIFERHGESRFRKIEEEIVSKVSKQKNHIIISGGGVVLSSKNMRNLQENGVIIYLKASPDIIYNRIKKQTHRPLLQVQDPKKEIQELLDSREDHYNKNDYVIDTDSRSVDEVITTILDYLS
jgi:shikimate kinase|tara:strand:+ start:1185 stop:1691 length:507 start_codon:yes stop_codon:yes gene_type:complete